MLKLKEKTFWGTKANERSNQYKGDEFLSLPLASLINIMLTHFSPHELRFFYIRGRKLV